MRCRAFAVEIGGGLEKKEGKEKKKNVEKRARSKTQCQEESPLLRLKLKFILTAVYYRAYICILMTPRNVLIAINTPLKSVCTVDNRVSPARF